MLRRISYQSRRNPALTDEEVLAEIITPSVARNQRAGITACLWCGPGAFVQVLEGEAEDVEALMRRVVVDPRHSDIIILSRSHAVLRLFDSWPMKVVTPAQSPASVGLVEAVSVAHEPGAPPIQISIMPGPMTALVGSLSGERSAPPQPSPETPLAGGGLGSVSTVTMARSSRLLVQAMVAMLGEFAAAPPLIYTVPQSYK